MASVPVKVFVGAAVACFLFGIFLGIPITYFAPRWRRKRTPPDSSLDLMEFALRAPLRDWPSTSETMHLHSLLPIFHSRVSDYVRHYVAGIGSDNSSANPYQSSCFTDLAGPHEDWDRLLEFDQERRESALTHFICRFLYRRMVHDGDLAITLLPVDMLSTYRRMLTKSQPTFEGYVSEETVHHFKRITLLSRNYWRVLTTYWGSERYSDMMYRRLPRTDCLKLDCRAMQEQSGLEDSNMRDDDPRMPRVLATEELLERLLSPFDRNSALSDSLRIDSADARKTLRSIMTMAADLALLAFAEPEPTEFYWPPTNRREGYGPNDDDGMLECFGIRQRWPVPGLEESSELVKTEFLCKPRYNDTAWFENTFEAGEELKAAWERMTDAGHGQVGSAEATVLEGRRKKVEEYRERQKEAHEVPGWDGAE